MAKLGVITTINSAHGKHIHGHTFQIEIIFEAPVVNNTVGNLDFHDLQPKIDVVINTLDKTYLEDVLKERATIENIAIYILKNLSDIEYLYSVIVWEGPKQYVEIRKEEIAGE